MLLRSLNETKFHDLFGEGKFRVQNSRHQRRQSLEF